MTGTYLHDILQVCVHSFGEYFTFLFTSGTPALALRPSVNTVGDEEATNEVESLTSVKPTDTVSVCNLGNTFRFMSNILPVETFSHFFRKKKSPS